MVTFDEVLLPLETDRYPSYIMYDAETSYCASQCMIPGFFTN